MRSFILTFLCSALLAASTTTHAAEAQPDSPRFHLQFHGGQYSFSGDLANADVVGYGLGGTFRLWSSPEDSSFSNSLGGAAFLATGDVAYADVETAQNTSYPFRPEKKLHYMDISVGPLYCVMTRLPVQTCVGAGYTIIKLTEPDKNEQLYGGVRLADVRVGRLLQRDLSIGLRAWHLYHDQMANEKRSHLTVTGLELMLGKSL